LVHTGEFRQLAKSGVGVEKLRQQQAISAYDRHREVFFSRFG